MTQLFHFKLFQFLPSFLQLRPFANSAHLLPHDLLNSRFQMHVTNALFITLLKPRYRVKQLNFS